MNSCTMQLQKNCTKLSNLNPSAFRLRNTDFLPWFHLCKFSNFSLALSMLILLWGWLNQSAKYSIRCCTRAFSSVLTLVADRDMALIGASVGIKACSSVVYASSLVTNAAATYAKPGLLALNRARFTAQCDSQSQPNVMWVVFGWCRRHRRISVMVIIYRYRTNTARSVNFHQYFGR